MQEERLELNEDGSFKHTLAHRLALSSSTSCGETTELH